MQERHFCGCGLGRKAGKWDEFEFGSLRLSDSPAGAQPPRFTAPAAFFWAIFV
jgi:hypothetical protein